MDKLSIPLQDIGVDEIYETCINSYRDDEKKKRLIRFKERITEEAEKYKGSVAEIIKMCEASNDENAKEIVDVYTEKFAKSGFKKGYYYYSEIKKNVYRNRCPICEIGVPTTLDHYLPKEKYPFLSIVPANLVPQCLNCNCSKHSYVGTVIEEMLPHPYFDDLSKDIWLKATLRFGTDIEATYSNGYDGTDIILKKRINLLLSEYQLSELYGVQASSRISGCRDFWKSILEEAGESQLKAHLEREEKYMKRSNLNGWETALYRALNDQFSMLISFFRKLRPM